MRAALALLLAAPLLAQSSDSSHWYLDVHQMPTTLEGHFSGTQDGQPIMLDLQSDFGLDKDKTHLGGSIEYQGPRFGLEVSTEGEDYKGKSRLNRDVTIDGQTFNVGMDTTSTAKLQTTTVNWTIRFMHPSPVWIGVDLGARIWDLDLSASGYDPMTMVSASASVKIPMPIPQIGLSAGFLAMEDRVSGRAYYHLLTYHGAKYHNAGADLRFFPVKHLGLRVFTCTESFDVPNGSIQNDLEIKLDHKGTGFGLVLQF